MDDFERLPVLTSDPGVRHFQIVPSNDVDMAVKPRAIYCQADGVAVVRDSLGVDLPYAMVAGQVLPFRGVRILATGTTGTFYGWA